jgi:uncharacterized protein (TIGR03066 family)
MLRAVALFAVLFGVSLAATAEDKKDTPSEAKLIGKWKIAKTSKGPLPFGMEITLDIQKDGKYKVQGFYMGKKTQSGSGTWKLDGSKFLTELTEGPEKGNKSTATIKKLTDTDMVMEDPKGVVIEFTQAKEAKAPDKK